MNTPLQDRRQFYRNVLVIGLPVALQNLLTTSAGMVDTIMIGTEGETAMAAAGICALFSMLFFAGYFGFCNGGMIFFAQYWGAKDERGICRSYGLTLTAMMAVGLIFGALAVFAPEFILSVYTDKESIRQAGIPYLRIVGWSYPLQTLAMAIGSLLRSIEKVKLPLFASVASLIANTFLNWVLIFGRFGFPRMGIRGAAVGTVIAGVVHILALFVCCLADEHSFVIRIREQYRWDKAFVKKFFAKIVFVVANEVLYGVGQLFINMILGRQTEAGIAAFAVFRVLEGFIFAFFGGFANAGSVMVGKRIGAGEHLKGYRDAKRFILLTPAVTLAIWLIILLLRGVLLRSFGLGAEAFFYVQGMIFIYTVTGTLRSCNYMANTIYRAGGEPVFGTTVELCGLFLISIPATAIAGLALRLHFLAVFFMLFLDEFIRLGIFLRYIHSGKWIKPVTHAGKETLPEFKAHLARSARAP
ncbi:MAG: MATE family efflux transporter [Treponema sp.]|jgi:putative MATE family efflux protein|nr:MATE family efflux transporter [Treponema sp.]